MSVFDPDGRPRGVFAAGTRGGETTYLLGKSFGLPHVDVDGYDMKTNESFMSYNPKHHTREFTPSATPGVLIAEDLRALALNRRVFPELRFDPARDVPSGYKLAERIVPLGPMQIPNQPDGPKFATESGEEFGTMVANLAKGPIGRRGRPGDSTGRARGPNTWPRRRPGRPSHHVSIAKRVRSMETENERKTAGS